MLITPFLLITADNRKQVFFVRGNKQDQVGMIDYIVYAGFLRQVLFWNDTEVNIIHDGALISLPVEKVQFCSLADFFKRNY